MQAIIPPYGKNDYSPRIYALACCDEITRKMLRTTARDRNLVIEISKAAYDQSLDNTLRKKLISIMTRRIYYFGVATLESTAEAYKNEDWRMTMYTKLGRRALG